MLSLMLGVLLGAVKGVLLGVLLGAVLGVVEGHLRHPNNRDNYKSSRVLHLTTTTTTTGKQRQLNRTTKTKKQWQPLPLHPQRGLHNSHRLLFRLHKPNSYLLLFRLHKPNSRLATMVVARAIHWHPFVFPLRQLAWNGRWGFLNLAPPLAASQPWCHRCAFENLSLFLQF